MTSKSTPIKIIFAMPPTINNNISLQIRESQTDAGREARTSLSYGGGHKQVNQHVINHNEISQLLDKYIFTHKDNYNYVDNKNAISMFSQISMSTSSDVKLYFTFKNYSIFTHLHIYFDKHLFELMQLPYVMKRKKIHEIDRFVDNLIHNDKFDKRIKDSMIIRLALLRSSDMNFSFGDAKKKNKYKNKKHIFIE
ncbi:MAG: hypothetical protein QXD60_01090, partial [Nanopusillaceae archaeon]